MNKGEKKPLVPELRFPEFRDASSWKRQKAGGIFDNRKEPGIDGLEIYSVTMNDGMVKRSSLERKFTDIANSSGNKRVHKADIVYNMMRMWQGAFGVAIEDCLVSPAYIVLAPKGETRSEFFGYLLKLPEYLELLTAHSRGITKDRLRLYFKDFAVIPLRIPGLPEQQKIADCLSSLDSLITAHSAKLAALQAHKKDLLQQLFPAEGQTTPARRFLEFQNTGDWKEVRIKSLGDLIPGLTYSPSDVREKGLLVLRSSNVQDGEISLVDCVYVDPEVARANLSQPNDILICVRNGSTRLIGKNALIPKGMPLCTHGAFMTVFRSETPQFTFQLFQTPAYYKQVAADLGATINSINGNQFRKYNFAVPKTPEQQKIAICLSSLDTLITTQTEKIAALKTHKQGLMQQLFPNTEEVKA